MSIKYETNSNWLKLPKEGQEYDFSVHGPITKAEKVEGKKGFNFMQKKPVLVNGQQVIGSNGKPVVEDVDLGYRYEYTFTDEKVLSIASWSPYYAFAEANVNEGDIIKVSHPAKGQWIITKMEQPF